MPTHYTFTRSCTNWREFAQAEKTTVETGLTLEEARAACKEFNDNLTDAQRAAGTKMEYTEE